MINAEAWRGRVGWRERMVAAFAIGGCSTQAEWLEKFPGTHCWFVFDLDRRWESCAACGTVRRADDSNKPCPGVSAVSLREPPRFLPRKKP